MWTRMIFCCRSCGLYGRTNICWSGSGHPWQVDQCRWSWMGSLVIMSRVAQLSVLFLVFITGITVGIGHYANHLLMITSCTSTIFVTVILGKNTFLSSKMIWTQGTVPADWGLKLNLENYVIIRFVRGFWTLDLALPRCGGPARSLCHGWQQVRVSLSAGRRDCQATFCNPPWICLLINSCLHSLCPIFDLF